MMTDSREAVGAAYDREQFFKAQKMGWEVINRVVPQIKPGMSEEEGKAILSSVMKDLGSEKIWHPSWLRMGPNTRKPYGAPSDKSVRLRENDVFFLDIGPVFYGHESDVGATFQVGNDPAMAKLIADSKKVFDIVRDHFYKTKISGVELYEFARKAASDLGWELSFEGASGHRISDFPHSVHYRGSLNKFEAVPTPNLWILEIHLHDTERNIGAFYEDVL